MLEIYFKGTYYGDIPPGELTERLYDASRVIDSLTFNRIVKAGYSSLTDFQKELIGKAVVKQADFAFENEDVLDSPLASYSISGISMSFENSKVLRIGNVTTTSDVYNYLLQTGLCYRGC